MQKLLERLSLKARIGSLVAGSMLMIFVYSGYLLMTAWKTQTESSAVVSLSQLAVSTSAAIHELQKERGRSSGFLGAGGKQFVAELPAQRELSDRMLAALDAAYAKTPQSVLGTSVGRQFQAAQKRRGDLAAMREKVAALQVPAPEAIGYYAALIADYASAIDQMALIPSDGALARRLVAYSSFVQAKENAGLERAVLSNVFGADHFTPALLRTFSGVVSGEQTRLSTFRTQAGPDDVAAFEQMVTGPEVAKATEWRELAFAKSDVGGFGVVSADWFAAATKRIDLMKAVEDRLSKGVIDAASSANRTANEALWLVLGLTAVATLFGVGGAIVIGRMTARALGAVSADLGDSAAQVVAAAREVAGSAQALAQGATEQAASIEETSASMEEMASMTHRNSENASQAAELMQSMTSQVDASNTALAAMVASMSSITESSHRVGKIIKTIDEIAFQTNILALNAAVEAARAGEAGMGFAVVADEVRNLAQRSSQAAKDTAALIEESITRSNDGAGKVEQVTHAIASIVQSAARVQQIVHDVREASRQQTEGIDQVVKALEQMEQVTQNTAATAEESAAASEELNAQAESALGDVRQLNVLVNGSGAVDVVAGLQTKLEIARHHGPTSAAPRQAA